MALQQPQQCPRPARQLSSTDHNTQAHLSAPLSPLRPGRTEESQEWILFSPQNDDDQSISQTSRTPRTATHWTASDIASLETRIRSRDHNDDSGTRVVIDMEDEDEGEGAELDSLDDGLHAFHHPFSATSNHLDQSGGTVLPTHDGFGTFPSGISLQEHLWQFERHNPQRRTGKHARRRSSVQEKLDGVEEQDEGNVGDDRTARIEKWRLDQSRAVLEEIDRETRRRRMRLSRASTNTSASEIRQSMPAQHPLFSEGPETIANDEQPQSESWWRRITRKVILDLIGLDEATLSVIFGEQLTDAASPTPTQASPIAAAALNESRVAFRDSGPSWEVKLLNRIARELGILVHQLAASDGTACDMHTEARRETLEYAGLPRSIPRQPSLRQRRREEKGRATGPHTQNLFSPTVPLSPLPPTEAVDTSLWGIEEEPDNAMDDGDVDVGSLQQEREYWERDVDVKMVFSYLKSRFSREPFEEALPSAADAVGPLPASWASVGNTSALGTSPESERRKEIIRQQHPLVSRAAERAKTSAATARRHELLVKKHHLESAVRKRTGDGSCATQSTKRSRHTRSGSSRHYWMEGGSLRSAGAMSISSSQGAWAEV